MKIAFAYAGDLATLTGGFGYDRRLVAGLSEAGHEVALLALAGDFPDPSPADAAAAVARLAEMPANATPIVDGLAYGALPAAALAKVAAPIVALVHHPLALETGVDPARAKSIAATERAALGQAAAVVVTSAATKATLVADYAVPAGAITVALPGLDRAWFVDRAPSTPPLIVAVGSLIARKGYDVLAAALLAVADIPCRCVIVGGARDPAVAARLCADLAPLGARATLRGEAEEAEVRALFAEATLFALATRYEGFGMVFAEAMAAGLPVVATRGGAVPDVVPASAGILAEVDDVAGIAAAMRRILTDGALAKSLSAGARIAAEKLPGWGDTARHVAAAVAAARARVATARRLRA